MTFGAIYTERHHTTAPAMFKYIKTVRDMAAHGGNWTFYDIQFVKQKARYHWQWDFIHWELHFNAMPKHVPTFSPIPQCDMTGMPIYRPTPPGFHVDIAGGGSTKGEHATIQTPASFRTHASDAGLNTRSTGARSSNSSVNGSIARQNLPKLANTHRLGHPDYCFLLIIDFCFVLLGWGVCDCGIRSPTYFLYFTLYVLCIS